MLDFIGAKTSVCIPSKAVSGFCSMTAARPRRPNASSSDGVFNVESVCQQLDVKELLSSTLAPHGFCDAENSFLLERTIGHSFLDQGSMHFFEFSRIFCAYNRGRSVDSVL